MLKTSHLQEMKRRYLGIYAPEPEEIDEHCGVCGEGEGIEEVEIEEGTALQVKMALSDVGLKGEWKNNKVYVKKSDVKKAEKALKGNVIYKGKPPVVVGEEVEEAHKVECPKCKGEGCEHCDEKGYHIKEEIELEEEVTAMDYDRLKKGDIITIEFKSAMSSGKSKFKVTAKNIVGKAKVGKVTLQSLMNPKGVKHFLYKRGNKVSFAQGDMGASVVKYTIEEVDLDEKKGSDYELYHKTFSDAMQHAYDHAKKKGFIVDPKEIDDKVATGPKKPSSGKTNRYILKTNKKKSVHIQVANLDNKRYELNMYIESKDVDTTDNPLETRRKKYIELNKKDVKNPLNKIKEALTRIRSLAEKPEEVELEEAPSPNQAAIDAYLKRGGKIKRHVPDPKKWDKEVEKTAKWFSNIARKEKEASKKSEPSRRYVQSSPSKKETPTEIMQHYKLPDYMVHDNIAKFPKILMSGINKIIPGVKFKKHVIAHQKWGKIPGLGVLLPGEKIPKLMIQWNQRVKDPHIDYIWADPEYAEKGTDPSTYRKNDMIVWINEAATAIDSAIKGKVDWFQRKEFEGKTPEDVAKRTLQYLKTKIKRMTKEDIDIEEVLDIKNTKMADVIKDFQDSDAPQFKGKSDKKRREMAIAAKLSADRNEETDKDEDPKSKKKDKLNLKPKMDETMKKYKDLLKGLKEKSVKEDSDKDTPGTQGDDAEWQKKRSAVLKKFGVKSCAALGTEKEKKACYKALDDAHVADHEEQVNKEAVEVDGRKKGYKEALARINSRKTKVSEKKKSEVKEAVTASGVEYGEQDFDIGNRLENIAVPNIGETYKEFMDQGLEGPYLWKGEPYFFDRKVGSWFSVTSEDYVDDDLNKELSFRYVKDGIYKPQFGS